MIVVNVYVESGCSFNEGEYSLCFEAAICDGFEIKDDYDKIIDCLENYEGEINEEIVYTFFLHRANIATAFPGYDPAFDIWQVLSNISNVNIQL